MTDQVQNCGEPLSAQAVGNALYGMQGMSSDDADVRSLVRAMTAQVQRCREPLSSQAVGNALCGMQGMSSDNADVRSLVRALAGSVEGCTEPLSAQAVGNALYGLQGLSNDDADVLLLLHGLSNLVQRCTEPMKSQSVSNALYGLQGMSSDDEDVRSLVRAMTDQLHRIREPMSAQAVGNALYGLQGMSRDDADVQALARALKDEVLRCSGPLDAQAVSNALYGLQNFLRAPEGKDLGSYLIKTFIKLFQDIADYTPEHIACVRSVVLSLPILRDILDENEVKECERIIAHIESKARVSNEVVARTVSLSLQLRGTQRMHTALMKALEKINASVSHNELLFGLFESDIVIRIPRAVDKHTVSEDRDREGCRGEEVMAINIELDGLHHRGEKKKIFCRLRDRYLLSRGVVIERMEVSTLDAMSEQDVDQWAQDVTAKSLIL